MNITTVTYSASAMADQGLTGTRTLKGLATSIGSSKQATIVLSHTSSGNTTTYSMSQSVTLTSNITLKIEKGAVLSIAAGKTLTINGTLDAGDYQIFSGTGTVTGLKYINAKWWGATGDGATDDTTALQSAFTALSSNSTLNIPNGVYVISAPITATTVNYITINFEGGAYISATDCGGLYLTSIRRSKINRVNIIRSARDWDTDDSGFKIDNCRNNIIDIAYIGSFKNNLHLLASDGHDTHYNEIFLGSITNGFYGVLYETSGTGSANTNTFYGGRIGLDSSVKTATAAYAATSYGFYQSITGSHSSHSCRMYGTTFENLHNGLYMYSLNAVLDGFYIEAVDNYWLAGGLTDSHIRIATWHRTGGLYGYDASKINLGIASRNNVWLGKYYNNNNVTMFTESLSGGFGWINKYSRDLDYQLYANATNNFLTVQDPASVNQYFNKQYESAAAPTSGTYYKGSVVWNSAPTAGDALGWICTSTGTMGTLSGVTATGTSGASSITVNSTTGLHTSARITIAGVTGLMVIMGISGKTVYLNNTIDATVSGAAVAYYNGVFAEINAQLSYRSGTASPSGSLTPYYVGEEYLNTSAKVWYKATGTANTDWVALN